MEKNLVAIKKRATIASQLGIALYWTFSSAGLEHLPYKQRVGGSNPSTSTKNLRKSAQVCFFLYKYSFLHNLSLFSNNFNKLCCNCECLCLKSAIFAKTLRCNNCVRCHGMEPVPVSALCMLYCKRKNKINT